MPRDKRPPLGSIPDTDFWSYDPYDRPFEGLEAMLREPDPDYQMILGENANIARELGLDVGPRFPRDKRDMFDDAQRRLQTLKSGNAMDGLSIDIVGADPTLEERLGRAYDTGYHLPGSRSMSSFERLTTPDIDLPSLHVEGRSGQLGRHVDLGSDAVGPAAGYYAMQQDPLSVFHNEDLLVDRPSSTQLNKTTMPLLMKTDPSRMLVMHDDEVNDPVQIIRNLLESGRISDRDFEHIMSSDTMSQRLGRTRGMLADIGVNSAIYPNVIEHSPDVDSVQHSLNRSATRVADKALRGMTPQDRQFFMHDIPEPSATMLNPRDMRDMFGAAYRKSGRLGHMLGLPIAGGLGLYAMLNSDESYAEDNPPTNLQPHRTSSIFDDPDFSIQTEQQRETAWDLADLESKWNNAGPFTQTAEETIGPQEGEYFPASTKMDHRLADHHVMGPLTQYMQREWGMGPSELLLDPVDRFINKPINRWRQSRIDPTARNAYDGYSSIEWQGSDQDPFDRYMTELGDDLMIYGIGEMVGNKLFRAGKRGWERAGKKYDKMSKKVAEYYGRTAKPNLPSDIQLYYDKTAGLETAKNMFRRSYKGGPTTRSIQRNIKRIGRVINGLSVME